LDRHLGRLGADRVGADIIVIDDQLTPEEALTQIQRQAANEWSDTSSTAASTTSSPVGSC
jgi:hypothetical protein